MCKQSKRRKHKDNPYVLIYNRELNKYMVNFKTSDGKNQNVEINKDLYCLFEKFELEDISQMNKYDRHIEHLEQTDELIYHRAIYKEENIDDIVYKKMLYELLKNEINKLPYIQRRRLKMYFFEELTLKQISEREHCTVNAIKNSIDIAIKKLRNLKKFNF